MPDVGKVYYVGAGPGDPELITIKGLKAIACADVIIYDRLVPIQLLQYAGPTTRFIYCGKEAGRHTMTQMEINRIITEEALQGHHVVRLKGGDPGIFGRVGEEAEACAKLEIPYEIIPGITSGFAAAAYAGFPVTHRELSSNVAIISGHRSPDNEMAERNWPSIARFDTIIVYMGVEKLEEIVDQLLIHGKSPTTPVAFIRWATTDQQQTIVATLGELGARAKERVFKPPAIFIVGEVVRYQESLSGTKPKHPLSERSRSLATSYGSS